MANLHVANRYFSEASAKFPATVDTVMKKSLPGPKPMMSAEFALVSLEETLPDSASLTLTLKY